MQYASHLSRDLIDHPLLHSLLQGTREGVCLLDAEGCFLLVNECLQAWLGQTQELGTLKLDNLLVPSQEARKLKQCLRKGLAREERFLLDLQASTETIPVQLRLSRIEWDGVFWLLQISDLRREPHGASNLLASPDADSLLNILPVPVVIVRTSDGRILQGNQEFVSCYGIPAQGQLTLSIADLFQRRSDWLFVLEEARRHNGQCLREVQVLNSDGSLAWAQICAQMTSFEGYSAMILVLYDITQSKQIEKSLEWRNRLVMSMMTAQSQFVANIDPDTLFLHILNNLLAMTFSEFGFLVALDPEFPETIQLLAVEHSRWDIETVEQYVRTAQQEFEQLYKQEHILLQALRTRQSMHLETDESISNYAWIYSFIGIPLFSSGQLVGMLGLANSPYTYGETLHMELNPLLITTSQILAAWRNDQQRRRAEADLQQSHQHLNHLHQDLRQLVDTACTPIFGLNLQGLVTEWNEAAVRLTGHSSSEVLTGTLVYQLVLKESHAQLDQALQKVREGEALAGLELALRRPADTPVRMLCSLSPRRDASGQMVGVWVIGQDITHLADYQQLLQQEVQNKTRALQNALFEQRQVTEHFKDVLNQEQAMSAFKERFVTIASHEFRGPLSAILMSAENLCNLWDVLSPDQMKRKVWRIRERADQLNYVINDIVLLTQIEAGHIRFHPEMYRISELCEQIIEEVQLATQNTHRVNLVYGNEELLARVDKNLLRMMLANLLHNAIKFSFDSPEVWFRVLPQQERLLFEIEDHGIGITDEELPHLFEPFYRSERVIFRTSGSGLGLELVQRAVQLHQGEIEVKRLVQGTKFCLSIPLRT